MSSRNFTFRHCISLFSLFLIHAAADIVKGTFPLEPKDVIFVGLSQLNSYHKERAEIFRQHLKEQFKDLEQSAWPVIDLLHERWPVTGAWTILPLMSSVLASRVSQKWLFISDVETRLDVTKLLQSLASFNHSERLFIGRGLYDKEHTIIHHFNFPSPPLAFPDFAAGFLMSLELVKHVAERLSSVKPKSDFSIDVKYELALYIHNKGEGVRLTDVAFLCTTEPKPECATTLTHKFPDCGEPISDDDLFIAVKTCEKFHKTRVPFVLKTWGRQTRNIEYYSHLVDDTIPTIDLGIPNTDGGHCAKTYAILTRIHQRPGMKWLIIVDDDTLLSVPRLRRLLACYDPTEPVVLGERYGYGVNAAHGYDYITGGGGMVFSQAAVHTLVEGNKCTCGTPNSPDDMHLGMCLKRFNIPCTHNPLFHQARPADYSPGYLSSQLPVSFHKHWNCDPYKEYAQWFAADDEPLDTEAGPQTVDTDTGPHQEL